MLSQNRPGRVDKFGQRAANQICAIARLRNQRLAFGRFYLGRRTHRFALAPG